MIVDDKLYVRIIFTIDPEASGKNMEKWKYLVDEYNNKDGIWRITKRGIEECDLESNRKLKHVPDVRFIKCTGIRANDTHDLNLNKEIHFGHYTKSDPNNIITFKVMTPNLIHLKGKEYDDYLLGIKKLGYHDIPRWTLEELMDLKAGFELSFNMEMEGYPISSYIRIE